MGYLLFGFCIGFLVRSLMQLRTNYRISKVIGEISDGMKRHKVHMDSLGKCIKEGKRNKV